MIMHTLPTFLSAKNIRLGLCLACFFLATPFTFAATPLKALMITGGCCHDYENQKRILSIGISSRAHVEWTIIHEGGADRNHKIERYNNPDWAEGFDVIVHNECFGGVTDVPFIENIARAHEKGVPAVMLHCAAHSYRNGKTDEWRKTMGISSYSHEKRRDFTVVSLMPDHPVMKGFPARWLDANDELYKARKTWPNTIPLAKAFGQDTQKDHTVVWLNQHGKGRVFATTLGHANSTMESPVYLDLVTRGLLWSCDKLNKDGTPKPGYEAR
jgi:type 1 glutamine amidotransferase